MLVGFLVSTSEKLLHSIPLTEADKVIHQTETAELIQQPEKLLS